MFVLLLTMLIIITCFGFAGLIANIQDIRDGDFSIPSFAFSYI